MKKSLVLFLSFLILFIPGCSVNNQGGQSTGKTEIVDQVGRKVSVPSKINKVISCYYTSTSTIIALGEKKKLVGIEMNADTRELYKKSAPEVLDLPAVGNSKAINIETCASLGADIIIIPDRLTNMIEQLETIELPVIVVSPEDDTKLLDMFKLFGEILGDDAKKNSEKLVSYYDEKINFLNSLNFDGRPLVYTTGNSSFLTTAASRMFQNRLINLAGGRSVSDSLEGNYWANITSEQLALWNPDFIFIPNGKSFSTDGIFSDEGLKNISAVTSKNVYEFPSVLESWDYPTPSVVLGMLWATNKIHSDLFSDEDLLKESKYFYKTFYGIEVTNEEVGYGRD